jgi:hypothetical protein
MAETGLILRQVVTSIQCLVCQLYYCVLPHKNYFDGFKK